MKIPVLFPKIFDYPFTYKSEIPELLNSGDFVKAPFGSNEITGVVWPYEQKTEKKFKIKKISKKINVKNLNPSMIEFISWFSKYNLVPLGMSLKMCLLNKDVVEKNFNKEFVKFKVKKSKRKFLLNTEQKKSLTFMRSIGNNYNVTVLEGVAGSGKTLVYFERVKDLINKGFQALILLPEIALTNQFSRRFKEFFGAEPAIWHSGTTKKNKSIIWKGITEGKIKIIIGARSSLFLPFKNLGTIIVDEEHDVSYKQDEGISYNARDMAITRASLENIPINLVTSIPSIETYNNIVNKKYHITKLERRYREAALPNIEIINLHSENLKKESWIASKTISKVNQYLEKGDQVLFFLNRRGYAPFVICKKCGYKFECPNCTVNLNFHRKLNRLLCHYCGHKSPLSRPCKDKEKCDLLFCGPGVERIFAELKKIYPHKKVEIFSSDTLKKNKLLKENVLSNSLYTFLGLDKPVRLTQEHELPWVDAKNYPRYGMDQDITEMPYVDTVCSIVSETNDNDTDVFMTEKIWKPIMAQHVFVVHGNHLYLQKLREMGFKTFSSYFDESYDLENDRDKKIDVIASLCKHLKTVNWQDIYRQTIALRQHNYDTFFNKEKLSAEVNKTLMSFLEFFDNN